MKIVLKGEDATHLTMLAGQAQSLDLPHYVVQDAGKTQVSKQDVCLNSYSAVNPVSLLLTSNEPSV